MRTSRGRSSGWRLALASGLFSGMLLGLLPVPAASQVSAYLLDKDTEVGSLQFRFLDSRSFSPSQLQARIGLTGRGKGYGLGKALSFIPLVPSPATHPFDPLSLQRDVVRLRQFYREAGFAEVSVRYEVALHQEQNLVDVTFLISEGRPQAVVSVTYVGPSAEPLEELLSPEIADAWRRFTEEQNGLMGGPLGERGRARMVGSALLWLMERGYPFPKGDNRLEVDSARFQARLTVEIHPGPRSRVGALAVEGANSVDDGVVLREVPIRVGDWYSGSKVSDGRQRIFRLNIFNMATADVAPLQEADSTVRVLFQVREGRPRSVGGEVGYTNTGGLALGGEWEHRNFSGGARTLAVTGSGETGLLAILNEAPDQYFRAAVSLRQPYLFVSNLSFVASPFGEYRDDYRDKSWEAGVDGTFTYQLGPLQAISLRYRLSKRAILEYRGPDGGAGTTRLLGSPTLDAPLDERVLVSAFTLSATLQRLDDPANPRRGFVLQPSLEATAPLGFPTNEYVKADLWSSLFRPLGGRARIAGSLRVGRLFPYGASVPTPGDTGALEFLRLRDVNLTAGGPTDVRGWGSRLLGPKVPDVDTDQRGDTVFFSSLRYAPLGGLARISGGLELQFPLSRSGSNFMGHVFVDGGRVWTPDDRFLAGDLPFDQDRAYYSTGAGMGIETPVGPIRFSLGYKLNPSALDVRDPADVLALILEGGSILDAPAHNGRRFQLHLTVGRTF